MKTGLTKKQKVTELFYNAKDPTAEIYTHDTKLKKRLLVYAAKHPELSSINSLTFLRSSFFFKATPHNGARRFGEIF